MILSFGLNKEKGERTGIEAGAGTEAGARAGAGFDLMKCQII